MRSLRVTIQMKPLQQYFLVVPYYAVQGGSNFRVVNRPQSYMIIQMKATEQHWLVVRHFAVQGGSNF